MKSQKKEDSLQSCSVLDSLIFGDGNDSFSQHTGNELPLNTA